MNIEEMRLSLAKARLHCHMLQVESNADAAAKDGQEYMTLAYQRFLSKLANEAEEMPQPSDPARLHCCILELERDAEASAKDTQEFQAGRYQEILSEIVDGVDAHGNTQASDNAILLQMLRDVPMLSKLPAVHHIQIYLVLS